MTGNLRIPDRVILVIEIEDVIAHVFTLHNAPA